MRFQTQWLRRVVGVFTLTTTLFSTPVTNLFAQASLFDPTFKVGHGANGIVYSIVVQDDGKIVVGGEFTQIAGEARTNLARLNSDGQLDESFPQGTDGAVYQLLKQPDGKIIAGGAFTNLQGVARQRIGRLLTNGTVDSTFDAGTNIASELAVSALAYQSDGRVLTALFNPTNYSFGFLNRLSSEGHLDDTFVQTNMFHGWFVRAVCPLTNGSIVVGGGFQTVNASARTSLALISTNGELDGSFVSPLFTDTNVGMYSFIASVVSLPDNSLLIGGKFWQKDTTNRFAIAKLTSTLDWDAGFLPDVFDPLDVGKQLGSVAALFLQPDGKIVVGGLFQEVGGYWRRNVVRLNPQGKVDPCFDPGIGLGDFWVGFNVLTLARQADQKVLVGGSFAVPVGGGSVVSFTSSNLTRFLPQSDCGVTRVHLEREAGACFVIGTCAPGGTNHLQQSTNLIDWVTIGFDPNWGVNPNTLTTQPYLFWELPNDIANDIGGLFFRVKKEY